MSPFFLGGRGWENHQDANLGVRTIVWTGVGLAKELPAMKADIECLNLRTANMAECFVKCFEVAWIRNRNHSGFLFFGCGACCQLQVEHSIPWTARVLGETSTRVFPRHFGQTTGEEVHVDPWYSAGILFCGLLPTPILFTDLL